MHGRQKIRTPEEKQELYRKEKAKKLAVFQAAWSGIVTERAKDSVSSELLPQIELLLSKCPDLYTLWNYRREILISDLKSCDEAAKKDVICRYELSFTQSCLSSDPKSYSTWHHRRWTLGQMINPDLNKELELCDGALKMDERNFHCWDYRRFIVEKGKIPLEKELEFSTMLIKLNFSNYSSWHYRTTLLPRLFPEKIPEGQLREELNLVLNAIFTDPNDQSAWFYSQFLLDQIQRGNYDAILKKLVENVKELCEEEPDNEWVLHAYVKLLLLGGSSNLDLEKRKFVETALEKLIQIDPLRSGYYDSLKAQV